MENKPIKFNPDLESEGGKLYMQYCEEKGIDFSVTAGANFCLGYMAVKEAQTAAVWVKATTRLPVHLAHWNMPVNADCAFHIKIDGKNRIAEIFDERKAGEDEPVYCFSINEESVFKEDFHRIEWLDESAAGREDDAVEFAEWCANNYQWEYDPTSDECRWLEADNFYTTAELYAKFKQQKQKR